MNRVTRTNKRTIFFLDNVKRLHVENYENGASETAVRKPEDSWTRTRSATILTCMQGGGFSDFILSLE